MGEFKTIKVVPLEKAVEAARAQKADAAASRSSGGWNEGPFDASVSVSAMRYNPLARPAAGAMAAGLAALVLAIPEATRPIAAALAALSCAMGIWSIRNTDWTAFTGGVLAKAGMVLSAAAAALMLSAALSALMQPQAIAIDAGWDMDTDLVGNVTHTRRQSFSEKYRAKAENLGLAIGDTAVLDNVFTDNLEVTVDEVGSGPVAKDGTALTGVDVTYRNPGPESTFFGQYDWKARDADGNVVEAVPVADIALLPDHDRLIDTGELAAGKSVSGTVYFPAGQLTAIAFYPLVTEEDPGATWKTATG